MDRVFAFEQLHQASGYLASCQHFGKICIRPREPRDHLHFCWRQLSPACGPLEKDHDLLIANFIMTGEPNVRRYTPPFGIFDVMLAQ